MSTKPKTCQCCGKVLVRKRYGKRLESSSDFKKRRFCNLSCSNTRTASARIKRRQEAMKNTPVPDIAPEGLTPLGLHAEGDE